MRLSLLSTWWYLDPFADNQFKKQKGVSLFTIWWYLDPFADDNHVSYLLENVYEEVLHRQHGGELAFQKRILGNSRKIALTISYI